MTWKGGMKFSRKRIGKKRLPSKRELKKMLRAQKRLLNEAQDLMNKEVTFCIGKLCLGFPPKESEAPLLKLIKGLRKKDYCQQKLDGMIKKASNGYRFGFETPRMVRGIKGMMKEDRW
jgi:hypothetical protein